MAKITNAQKKLFEELHKSRMEDFKTFNKKDYRGVWNSIVDKYPESAHFVYELLQNADDTEASKVEIVLKHDQMLFKHNGKKHFDITKDDAEPLGDINSITAIGDSSKTNVQNKIGKFGVGFKAVFQYTDTPEIYDNVFKFKIENYIVPVLLPNDHIERRKGETLFVFPFKNSEQSYKDIKNRLETLENPILFLRNLKRIVWRAEDSEGVLGEENVYSKKIVESLEFGDGNVTMEHLVLSGLAESSDVFLFSKKVNVNSNTTEHIISVGYYYDSYRRKLITNTKQKIYCFFPTKETFNTCFISHAPFLLTDNRQNLKPNERLNDYLISHLSDLAAKAIVYLRDYGISKNQLLIDENITEIIPKESCYNYYSAIKDYDSIAILSFKNILNKERLLLSRNGEYLSLQEAYKGSPKELVDLLSQKQFAMLRSWETAKDLFDPISVDFLKWELSQNISKRDDEIYKDVKPYKSADFASDITPEFMAAQSFEWVKKMYGFVINSAGSLWKRTDRISCENVPFRNIAPIIKNQKGEWVSPYDENKRPNVYLPIQEVDNSDYNFVDYEYFCDDTAKKLFTELELKAPDELDYIRNKIFPKFVGNEISINNKELVSDFIMLIGYYRKLREDQVLMFIEETKNVIYIVGSDGYLHKPNKSYLQSKNLEDYFSTLEGVNYFDMAFYKDSIDKFGENIVEKFVERLGVRRYPEIQEEEKLENLPCYLQQKLSQVDYRRDFECRDFCLKGFYEFVKGKVQFETSVYLWNEVLPAIEFANYEELYYAYKQPRKHNKDIFRDISSFTLSLKYDRWIFDRDNNLHSPGDVTLEDLHPMYDRNNGLINFLDIRKKEECYNSKLLNELLTDEQKQKLKFVDNIRQLAGSDVSDEEIYQFIRQRKEQKSRANSGLATHEQRHNSAQFDEGFLPNREELRQPTLSDMFSTTNHSPKKQKEEEDKKEEQDDGFDQKIIEQQEKHNKIKELREIAENAEKYSKEWFDALIELEYRGGTEESKDDFGKSINITFNSICREKGSDSIYVLRNPSRGIPLWLEEVGEIEVKCTFSNKEEQKIKFEVANVRENSLRLKASNAMGELLSKTDCNMCTKATITLKNQIDLMGKLRTAFNGLGLEDGFNLKDNLSNNLKFIFGPPGTGKTTTLAKNIIDNMRKRQECRILVLAPTNTACDELARKIKACSDDDCDWLYRFVASSDEELSDIVIDRDSLAFKENKCCIISTMARLSFDGFNGLDAHYQLRDIDWDVVVCDEASMIPLAEMALAIYNFVDTPIIIAGDPMQIKPILHESEWKDENIYTMVNLDRFDKPTTEPIQFEIENLNTQYRSVPAIGELFSKYAYDGKLGHYRSALNNPIQFGKIDLKPINFISFKVERYDSVFGIKKLDGSNVHIYSVLFTVEMLKYVVSEYAKSHDEEYTIGIVCPYSPQAQLIESLIMQSTIIPDNIKVTVGTVHRFQGGQCNFMFVVLNPPLGMKVAPERIFLNNKNILNVAISRAQDYLCILLPHYETEGYDNLYEINKIGRIACDIKDSVAQYTCDQIEESMFGRKFFIENNAFVTSHQLTNVYSKAAKMYEIRIDENSVDIQLGSNERSDEGQN